MSDLSLLNKILRKAGFQINRLPPKPPPIDLWKQDEEFINLMESIIDYTRVEKLSCYMLYQFSKQVANLSGEVAEIGVYKGGSAKLLAKMFESTGKILALFDTFFGMPPVDPDKDIFQEGAFGDTSLEKVKAYLSDCKNVNLYQGLFPDTATSIKDKTFCFVHVDVDIYKSVMDCCNFFYSRMTKGGVIIFDDYGYLKCPGAKMAVDEFFADKSESPCYISTGQCVVIRH